MCVKKRSFDNLELSHSLKVCGGQLISAVNIVCQKFGRFGKRSAGRKSRALTNTYYSKKNNSKFCCLGTEEETQGFFLTVLKVSVHLFFYM